MSKTKHSTHAAYAVHPSVDIASSSEFILKVQKRSGEIPWSEGGKTDPWDHVESAMGLTIGGFHDQARQAYLWSRETQLSDGSWWSDYRDGRPQDGAYKDSNMTAYIAVGVFHYFLVTGDNRFLGFMWNTVSRAMDYVLGLQGRGGEILWAKRVDGSIDRRALLTGSSSIYMSLGCALRIASLLGRERPDWEVARIRLGNAIRNRPHLFDLSKSRYSMDWYYPVLCGAIRGKEARGRIDRSWDTFVIRDWGVRCVSDRQWVTMAETSEFVISLAAIGEFEAAEMVFSWLRDKRYEEGIFWTGVTFPEREIYPREMTTWTAGAVLLAADILYGITPASQLFGHDFWRPFTFPFSPNNTQ
jgi:hypothetical protein